MRVCFRDTGIALIRIALGVMWIAHALLKIVIFTIPGFSAFLEANSIPTSLAWPISLAELFGGVAILVGCRGRIVSLALLPILLGAMWIHIPNGWAFTAANGGWEYPLFLIIVSLAHALMGDGAFAAIRDTPTITTVPMDEPSE